MEVSGGGLGNQHNLTFEFYKGYVDDSVIFFCLDNFEVDLVSGALFARSDDNDLYLR